MRRKVERTKTWKKLATELTDPLINHEMGSSFMSILSNKTYIPRQ